MERKVIRVPKGRTREETFKTGQVILFEDDRLGRSNPVIMGSKVQDKPDFPEFVHKCRRSFVNLVASQATGYADMQNKPDYRWTKSDYLSRSLDKRCKDLKHAPQNGFDMYFKHKLRISIKIQGENDGVIFQHKAKTGNRLRKPGILVMTNGHNKQPKPVRNFDYLFALEVRFHDTRRIVEIALGVASWDTITDNNGWLSDGSEQLRCRLYNDQWDYRTDPFIHRSKLAGADWEGMKNAWFDEQQNNAADEMLTRGAESLGLDVEEFFNEL
jgi:hypothetical protein